MEISDGEFHGLSWRYWESTWNWINFGVEELFSKNNDKGKRHTFVAEKSTGRDSYAFQYETEMKEGYLGDKSLQEIYFARRKR